MELGTWMEAGKKVYRKDKLIFGLGALYTAFLYARFLKMSNFRGPQAVRKQQKTPKRHSQLGWESKKSVSYVSHGFRLKAGIVYVT